VSNVTEGWSPTS